MFHVWLSIELYINSRHLNFGWFSNWITHRRGAAYIFQPSQSRWLVSWIWYTVLFGRLLVILPLLLLVLLYSCAFLCTKIRRGWLTALRSTRAHSRCEFNGWRLSLLQNFQIETASSELFNSIFVDVRWLRSSLSMCESLKFNWKVFLCKCIFHGD